MNTSFLSILEREIERQFFQSLDYHGIKSKPFTPKMDGEIHRFATIDGKKGNQDGAYKIHLDGTANWSIKDFRQHNNMIYCKFDPSYLSDSDRREYEEQIKQHHTPKAKQEQAQKRKEEAQQKEQSESAARAQALRTYEEAKNSGEYIYKNAYLQKKGINSEYYLEEDYLKVATNKAGNLLIPLPNISTGKFQSLQTIDPNGNKRFWPGLSRQGTAYIFSNDKPKEALNCKTIYICEGYATGASIQHTPGFRCVPVTVICAMSCNDITDIAKTVRKINPKAEITIAADHDEAGLAPAIKCLEQGIADYVSIPPERGEDWNDYERKHPDLGDKDANAIMHRKQSKEQLPELKAELKALEEIKQAKQKAQAQELNPVIEPIQQKKEVSKKEPEATYEPEAPNIYEDLIGEPKEPDSATNITPPWLDYSDCPEPKEPPEAYVAQEASRPQATKEATPKEKSDGIQNSDKFKQFDSIRHKFDKTKPYKRTEYIAGLFPRRHITVVAGAPGIGKSLVLQRIYSDLSIGGNIADIGHTNRPMKVIVITAEFPEDGLMERANDFGFENNPDYLEVIDIAQFPEVCFDLNTREGMELLEHILQSKPDILILDSLGALYTGKENDNTAIGQIMNSVSLLAKQYDTAIIIVHHIRKRLSNEQERPLTWNDIIGGSAIVRYCAQVYGLEFSKQYEMPVITTLKTWKKPRKPIGYKIEEEFYGRPHLEIIPNLKDLEDKLASKIASSTPPDWKEFLDAYMIGRGENGATLTEIKEFLAPRPDCPKEGAIRTELTRQVKDGVLIKLRRGIYAIPSDKLLKTTNESEQLDFKEDIEEK